MMKTLISILLIGLFLIVSSSSDITTNAQNKVAIEKKGLNFHGLKQVDYSKQLAIELNVLNDKVKKVEKKFEVIEKESTFEAPKEVFIENDTSKVLIKKRKGFVRRIIDGFN